MIQKIRSIIQEIKSKNRFSRFSSDLIVAGIFDALRGKDYRHAFHDEFSFSYGYGYKLGKKYQSKINEKSY